jgi:hypothetical protein
LEEGAGRNAAVFLAWSVKVLDPLLDGDPGRIRTCNPQSRNLMLYPVELRDRTACDGASGF